MIYAYSGEAEHPLPQQASLDVNAFNHYTQEQKKILETLATELGRKPKVLEKDLCSTQHREFKRI